MKESEGYYRQFKALMDKAYNTNDQIERDKIEKEIDALMKNFFKDLKNKKR